ncbi:MAG: selenocysteine-specific translation elongation factor [Solirubrobacterales bacterium]
MSQPLTIGTAGHIDHGKTALVTALTGRDTDRLVEEKQRGISIQLGFAELRLGDRRLSLVDVPGHECFVRTMIAGASGIDAFLLVVAADDGPMPQTNEHLTVLRALGVEMGVVALSRCDLVGSKARRTSAAATAALVPDAPLIEVSVRTGEGLAELREALMHLAERLDRDRGGNPEHSEVPVLHLDRVFTIPGHGTVVTGTLWSGRIACGDRVQLMPRGTEARVRSIEVHDQRLQVAEAHQRVALNLAAIGRDEVQCGDVVTAPGADVMTTYRLDVELIEGVDRITSARKVKAHLGTRESLARVVDIGKDAVQLRLERPLLARQGDRVVIRGVAPSDTLGGGTVVRPFPPRHGRTLDPCDGIACVSDRSESEGARGIAGTSPPGDVGSAREPGTLAWQLLRELRDGGSRPRATSTLATKLCQEPRQVERALAELVAAGAAVRVRRDVVYPADEYERLRRAILEWVEHRGSISIAEARDLLDLSRKYAQALLEHLDATRALRREGDRHYPSRSRPL